MNRLLERPTGLSNHGHNAFLAIQVVLARRGVQTGGGKSTFYSQSGWAALGGQAGLCAELVIKYTSDSDVARYFMKTCEDLLTEEVFEWSKRQKVTNPYSGWGLSQLCEKYDWTAMDLGLFVQQYDHGDKSASFIDFLREKAMEEDVERKKDGGNL